MELYLTPTQTPLVFKFVPIYDNVTSVISLRQTVAIFVDVTIWVDPYEQESISVGKFIFICVS